MCQGSGRINGTLPQAAAFCTLQCTAPLGDVNTNVWVHLKVSSHEQEGYNNSGVRSPSNFMI